MSLILINSNVASSLIVLIMILTMALTMILIISEAAPGLRLDGVLSLMIMIVILLLTKIDVVLNFLLIKISQFDIKKYSCKN